jgi:hypothetical protein
MFNARHIGRVGALAVALGIGIATLPTPTPPHVDGPVSRDVKLSTDSTVLLLCGTTCPTWSQANVELIMNQFVTPTHPTASGDDVTTVAVTAPNESWPITGVFRALEFLAGDPRLVADGFPDEPWWKLSGLFDLTGDESIAAGVVALEDEIAKNPTDHLVIYGYSQGATIANVEKRRLAEQYPAPGAPDIDFVLGGDANLPNGGLLARFPGLHIPFLDWTFSGPALTDTQFDTVEINRQYDGFGDFPMYPLNVVADLNAVMGIVYLHTWPFDVSLAPEPPTTPPIYQGTHGDTTYYFFPTENLPLFNPLRTLGVPEPVIDVIEPVFRVIVERGYDRTIPPWEPTPARLIPRHDPAAASGDLVDAVKEGIDNARSIVSSHAPLRLRATTELSAPTREGPARFAPLRRSADATSTTQSQAPRGLTGSLHQVGKQLRDRLHREGGRHALARPRPTQP